MVIMNFRKTLRPFAVCGLLWIVAMLLFASLATACSGGGGSECREKPTVTTEAPTSIGAHDATFHGTVNPQGCETSYEFEYRFAGGIFVPSGGFSMPGFITPQAVSIHVSGLAAIAKYEVRTTATNLKGTTQGNIVSFTTLPDPPSVTTKAASEILTTTALLNGAVNSNKSATTYFFEYGLSKEYGSVTAPGKLEPGTESVIVKSKIEKLKPETLYHFRVTASNGGGAKSGLDETFKTK
jgi:hypothetical protein